MSDSDDDVIQRGSHRMRRRSNQNENNNNNNNNNIVNDSDDEDRDSSVSPDQGADYKALKRHGQQLVSKLDEFSTNMFENIFTHIIDTGMIASENLVSFNTIDNKKQNIKKRNQTYNNQSDTLKQCLNKLIQVKKSVKEQRHLFDTLVTELDTAESGSYEKINWLTKMKQMRNNFDESSYLDDEFNRFAETKVMELKDSLTIDEIDDNFDDIDRNNNNNNNNNEDSEDEDIDIMSSVNKGGIKAVKCPITMLLMKSPMKTLICSHVFEKSAIFSNGKEAWKNGDTIDCPVPGCNGVFKSQKDFYIDRLTQKRIKQYSRNKDIEDKRKEHESQFNPSIIDMTNENENENEN